MYSFEMFLNKKTLGDFFSSSSLYFYSQDFCGSVAVKHYNVEQLLKVTDVANVSRVSLA